LNVSYESSNKTLCAVCFIPAKTGSSWLPLKDFNINIVVVWKQRPGGPFSVKKVVEGADFEQGKKGRRLGGQFTDTMGNTDQPPLGFYLFGGAGCSQALSFFAGQVRSGLLAVFK
jgi:hypothetical protein